MSKSEKIPSYLLSDCSPQEKFLMENVFELKQNFNSLQDGLTRVENLQKIANGRTSKNEGNIENLQKQLESWINLKGNFLKVVKNKYVICGLAFLAFLAVLPLANYVNSTGGPVKLIESIAKAIWG